MIAVLQIVAPVFALVAIGYAAGLRRLVSDEGLRTLNGFVYWLALPALLFGAASRATGGGAVALAFFGGAAVVLVAAALVSRFVLRQRLAESGLFAMNACYGNTAMMGLAVILAAYGPAGVPPAIAIVGLHSLLLMPPILVLAELGLSEKAQVGRVVRSTVLSVLRNPLIVAVALGTAWSALHLPPLPVFANRFLDMLGGAVAPIALFCLGASLRGFQLRRDWPDAALAGVLKLLALPALVWGLGLWIGLPRLELEVAVTMAAMPTGANAFMLARRYAVSADRSGATVLLTTALSVVTLGAVIAHFRG